MTADLTMRSGRRQVLFLSFIYPTKGGSGTQMRSAALVRMLAAQADVHLVIAGYFPILTGPRDPQIESACKDMLFLRIPGTGWAGPRLASEAEKVTLPTVDCSIRETAARVLEYYEVHRLEELFVFRFDAVHFVVDRLESFPNRQLDLDELPSRRDAEIERICGSPEGELSARRKTDLAASRVLEKMLLRRFQRVFVSSAVEAEEVRRRTGFAGARVLPNIYGGNLEAQTIPKRTRDRREILFVGTLSYAPNSDAVLYFCREILPLIRERREVVFRIVGMGATTELDVVRGLPGVELMGYQASLEASYASASVVVVPLRAGAGTRLKILEAFAHRRPVVSTSIGAQGLDVTNGEDILLTDDPLAFASACIRLMDDAGLEEAMCDRAISLLRERYSDDALRRCYAEIIAEEGALAS